MSEPINEALEAELREDPYGDTAVYGDWLAQRGHPRGELIALQTAGLADEAARWLERHPDLLPFPPTYLAKLSWDRGFIRRAELRDDRANLLDALIRHPSARLLRELSVVAPVNPIAIGSLCESPPLPLRVLAVDDSASELAYPVGRPCERELCRQFPRLRALSVSGTPISVEYLGPELVELDLAGEFLPEATARALAACPLPLLETLHVAFDPGEGRDGGAQMLRPFFARTDLPRLRRLELWEADHEVVSRMLRDAPFRARVEVHFGGAT